MRPEVEKLKKYYQSDPPKISKNAIDMLLSAEKITQEEYDYITSSDDKIR